MFFGEGVGRFQATISHRILFVERKDGLAFVIVQCFPSLSLGN